MENEALCIYHAEKGGKKPPIAFKFPEPKDGSTVPISIVDNTGKGWFVSSLTAIGVGRLFCFRQYSVFLPVTFTFEPSEPVVCLRIHVGVGAKLAYKGGGKPISLEFRDSRIFWQGNRILENRLMADEHTLIELYFRPKSLSHLSDRAVVMDLIDLSLTEKYGPLDQYVFNCSNQLDTFVWDMLDEMNTHPLSVERFHYLCDCLLLMCLGEEVQVAPRPIPAVDLMDNTGTTEPHYKPSSDELEMLAELEGRDRNALTEELHALLAETAHLKQSIMAERELNKKLEEVAAAINEETYDKAATEFMKFARLMADWHKSKKLTAKQKKLLKEAIVYASESAFVIRPPSVQELDFYVQWAGRPYAPPPVQMDTLASFISRFLPPDAPKISPVDGTDRSKNLFLEQIEEAFGLGKFASKKAQAAEHKPKEVVELYQKLMDRFCDTLDFGKEGQLLRSDIVRELDRAYHYNDLLTLLQIEAENLAVDPEYTAKQSTDKLKWMIVALRFYREDFRMLQQEQEDSPAYHYLQTYHRLGDDMQHFRQFLENYVTELNPVISEFVEILEDIESEPSEFKVVTLAKCILDIRMKE